jgi:hypothetical protein
MPYVAVKGGEQAIYNAEALIKAKQRGDRAAPEVSSEQIKEISKKKVTSRRGEASGQKRLEKSRQFPSRCFAPTANAQYSVNSFSEIS